MPKTTKISTLVLLSSLFIAPLSGCTTTPTPAPASTAEQSAVSRPDDGRLKDNTDVYTGDSNYDTQKVASAVEGFYKNIGNSDVRIKAKKQAPLPEAERIKALKVTYKDAFSYVKQGDASEASMYALFSDLTKDFDVLAVDVDYGIVVNIANITVKGDRAIVDTISSKEMIGEKSTLIPAERAKVIHMVDLDGEWYIDVPATITSIEKA